MSGMGDVRSRRHGVATAFTLLGGLALAAPACSDGGGKRGTPLATPTFFQVQGRLTLTPEQSASVSVIPSPPTEQDFLLYVDPLAPSVVSFLPGQADRKAATTDGVSFAVAEGFIVGLPGSCAGSDVYYSSFRFTADGAPGTLAGTATGLASLGVGDVAFSYKAALTFTGTRDLAGPSLDVGAAVDPFHVADLRANRPLPAVASARLDSAGESIELRPLLTTLELDLGFAIPPATLPRYGTAYDVIVTPWQDLAGNPGVPPGQLTTRPAPVLVAREDFENADQVSGDGTVVDAAVLPPITGLRSAVLATGQSSADVAFDSPHVSARLQVVPGNTVVAFAARPFSRFATASTYGITMQAGVPGGAVTAAVLPATETITWSASAAASGGVGLGEVRTIEIPLPAGVDSEVIVDLHVAPPIPCGLPLPPAAGYLIDDLRVE